MKTLETIKDISLILKNRGFESPGKEAEVLTLHGLGITLNDVYRDNPEISSSQLQKIRAILKRRLKHEPLQYIIGYEDFMDMRIKVGPGVLIPRPETELLAEQAIKTVKRESLRVKRALQKTKTYNSRVTLHDSQFTILDLCTGSGCLALAVAREFPDAHVYGSDVSGTAVEFAEKNARLNGISNVTFLKGNLFFPFDKQFIVNSSSGSCASERGRQSKFDLIISNPPYIRTDDIVDLASEVKDWEPVSAINGGTDGLDVYRKLISSAGRYLNNDGLIVLELGAGQAEDIKRMLVSSGYSGINIVEDYAGIQGVIIARWGK